VVHSGEVGHNKADTNLVDNGVFISVVHENASHRTTSPGAEECDAIGAAELCNVNMGQKHDGGLRRRQVASTIPADAFLECALGEYHKIMFFDDLHTKRSPELEKSAVNTSSTHCFLLSRSGTLGPLFECIYLFSELGFIEGADFDVRVQLLNLWGTNCKGMWISQQW